MWQCAGDLKEFGFRDIADRLLQPGSQLPPLQPAPVQDPSHAADPRLTVTVCVSGMIAAVEVTFENDWFLFSHVLAHSSLCPQDW
jgi:hypothetical protein